MCQVSLGQEGSCREAVEGIHQMVLADSPEELGLERSLGVLKGSLMVLEGNLVVLEGNLEALEGNLVALEGNLKEATTKDIPEVEHILNSKDISCC